MTSKHTIGNPHRRPRRLRKTAAIRAMINETTLKKEHLIAPIFVSEIESELTPIESLPGVFRVPVTQLAEWVLKIQSAGIKAVMLFPVIFANKKNTEGSEAWNPQGLIQNAINIVKKAAPELVVFADVALDPFTSHGHDGLLNAAGEIENDTTVDALCKMSVTLAKAGVDFVSPSDMMDGRIGAIRTALDEAHFQNVGILAYSAKYASAFYGPFRQAIASGARGLDKKTYQMSTGQSREAAIEAELDVAEGADMLMVKPALCYLDIVAKVRAQCNIPIVAYHVSGEYAMLKAAVQNNWLDEKPAVLETLLSIRRAGADLIVTYYAQWAAENLDI